MTPEQYKTIMGCSFTQHYQGCSFTQQYLESLLWSEEPEGEAWSFESVSESMADQVIQDCNAFVEAVQTLELDEEPDFVDWSTCGHDFALTRNEHGAGFWDGDWGTIGDKLTELCQAFPKLHIYRQLHIYRRNVCKVMLHIERSK